MSQDQKLEGLFAKVKSGDQKELKEAENQSFGWENENLAGYGFALASYMAAENNDPSNRQLAGVILKGTITAKDEEIQAKKTQNWIERVPEDAKTKIKQAILHCLNDKTYNIRNTAAQITAKIAIIELPRGLWQDLIPNLFQNIMNQNSPTHTRQSILDTLGYICEEISPNVVSSYSDRILTAVVHGMRPEQPKEVKLSACRALLNALIFVEKNFENPDERKVLMDAVLTCVRTKDIDISVASFNILNEIATMHYDKLLPHIHQIFSVTMDAIKLAPEEVAKQAIFFWNTVAEEELIIIDDIKYALELKETPTRKCENFTKGAIEHLAPALTLSMTKQEDEDFDIDEFTIPKAASLCLIAIAQTVGDDVVPYVMPFVEQHLQSEDWRFKEASLLALGSILDGTGAVIQKVIERIVPIITQQHMKDSSTAVRDTSAWVLSRLCKLHWQTVVPVSENILRIMAQGLVDIPRVAHHCCTGILNLALAMQDHPNNPVMQHFQNVVQCLLQCTDRKDAFSEQLITAAYETLNTVLSTTPPEASEALKHITELILTRLDNTFKLEIVGPDDLAHKLQVQGLLLGVVQILAQKLEHQFAPVADRVMTNIVNMFHSKHNTGVQEEAFLTVAALATTVGKDFQKYMPKFSTFLWNGLSNFQEYQVCSTAVAVVADLARALGPDLSPYCDKILTLLLQNLQNRALDRSVKPPILSCFGDIAFAIDGNFEKYLKVVMDLLQQAAETVINTPLSTDNYDLIDYINTLREGICDAYTGIIQGMTEGNKVDVLFPYLPSIVRLIDNIAQDKYRNEDLSRAAVGLIGDLAITFRERVRQPLSQPSIHAIIQHCLSPNQSAPTKEIAELASTAVKSIL
jgi:importin subunit beta-1